MPTNDCNVLISGVSALVLRDEAASADDVKGGDTEETLWVVGAFGFKYFGADGNSGVDGIGDDENIGLWGGIRNSLCQVSDDGGIGVEEI